MTKSAVISTLASVSVWILSSVMIWPTFISFFQLIKSLEGHRYLYLIRNKEVLFFRDCFPKIFPEVLIYATFFLKMFYCALYYQVTLWHHLLFRIRLCDWLSSMFYYYEICTVHYEQCMDPETEP